VRISRENKIKAAVPAIVVCSLPSLLAGASLSSFLLETFIECINAPVQNLLDGSRTLSSWSIMLFSIETILALAKVTITELSSLEANTVQLEAFRILAVARGDRNGHVFQQAS
jgi:hypothetical protein